MLADIVLEGGGVKGIALVGALSYAESVNYRWNAIAGTSAGAMVGALAAAGYTGAELHKIMCELDFNLFRDPTFLGRVRFIGPLISIGVNLGLYAGDDFEEWLRAMLAAKGIHTFGDLKIHDRQNPAIRYKLQVIASDLSRGRMLVLPGDLRQYGLDPDTMDVARAVRMSAGIPYFYEPVVLRYGRLRLQKSYIVDGGLLSNYPVWIFDCPPSRAPRWPTFGLRLSEPNSWQPHVINGPVSLFTALFSTMMEAHDARAIKESNAVRTIRIDTLGVSTVDFDISAEQREALYQSGYNAARRFFAAWDFKWYKAKYRRQKRKADNLSLVR
ncbi:MAG TPA: patatin-like phospholipase family protein [Firmicutes bacterium]|nr:patatin-like phospholipase family protein [Bacillota bacterium]